MGINVNIDAEAVQNQVVQAILDAGIGKTIEKVVKGALQERVGYGTETVIEKAIKAEINKVIGQEVGKIVEGEEVRSQIQTTVTEMLTSEVRNKMINAAFQVMLGNLERSKW